MPITAENARELQRKGVQMRLARKFTPTLVPVDAVNISSITPILQSRATHALALLDKLTGLMHKAGDNEDKLDAYSRAYDRVFRAWVHLAGVPGPGQRKPPPTKLARIQAYPSPEVLPEPMPTQAATVRPSAGCGPVQPVQDIKSCASAPTPPTNTGQTPA